MDRVLTARQMIDADRYNIDKLGLSEDILIERAGEAVAEEIILRFKGGRVLVCVGKGNNGADGKVAAKILSLKHGFNVKVFSVFDDNIEVLDDKYDIILDCIFGTGLNKDITGKIKDIIEKINNSKSYIISCDIPSGLNGDNGLVNGVAIKANLTIAIQEYKTGLFLNDGLDYSGKIVVKDIGISVWEDGYVQRFSDKDVIEYFPDRKRNVHKGNFGKVAIVGGSKNFPGSIYLSLGGLTSLKAGAGYANLVVPESMYNCYALKNPECTLMTIKDDNGCILFDPKTMDQLLKYDVIVFGMGIGVSEQVYKTLLYLIDNYKGKLIIDADGLNTISKYGTHILDKERTCDVVLTPHIGEFSRLSNMDKQSILSDPINCAKEFAKEYNLIIVLKNAVSIITDGERVYLNTTGCGGMAKGGSGDVLSGFVGGVVARNKELIESVCSACYVFGRAGEIAQSNDSAYTITASDIVKNLGNAINSLVD